MKKVASLSLVCALLLGMPFVSADEKAKDDAKVDFKKIKCPVSGGPAKEASALDFKGAKVYFCCNNCPKAFAEKTKDKENEEGIALTQKANAQLVATKQARQVKCPLTGRPMNDEKSVEVAGVAVLLCCDGCKGKVTKAEGDAQIALVFSDGAFEKGFKIKGAKKGKKDVESKGLKALNKKKNDDN